MRQIIEQLKKLSDDSRMNQMQIAASCGLSQSQLSVMFKSPEREYRISTVRKLAAALGYQVRMELVRLESDRATDIGAHIHAGAGGVADAPEPRKMAASVIRLNGDASKLNETLKASVPEPVEAVDWYGSAEYLNYVELKKAFDAAPRNVENLRACAAAKRALFDLGWSMNDRDEWCPPGSVAAE